MKFTMLVLASLVAVIAAAFMFTACTDEHAARRVLDENGFTEVETTGYAWFACADSDFSHTGFVSKNAQGRAVTGVVCCGLFFKACTVRF